MEDKKKKNMISIYVHQKAKGNNKYEQGLSHVHTGLRVQNQAEAPGSSSPASNGN